MSTTTPPPGYASGKICYIEIPATDIRQNRLPAALGIDWLHGHNGWV